MRRSGVVVLLALLVFLGMLVPPAQAQAPAPKVTIGGTVDIVTSYHHNLSQEDLNYGRSDSLWATRQRFNPVILGELDKVRAVLALEIDLTWGLTGQNEGASPCTVGGNTVSSCTGLRTGGQNLAFSTAGGVGQSTDVINALETKWMYIEFPVPLTPWPSTITLGAQSSPVGRLFFKPTFWSDDFPGVFLTSTFTPALKGNLIYAVTDATGFGHKSTDGASNRGLVSTGNIVTPVSNFRRGDNFAIGASAMATPWQGLDVVPFWVYQYQSHVLPTNTQGTFMAGPAGVGGITSSVGSWADNYQTHKHYVGLDSRWRSGPWSLDPTFVWLVGDLRVPGGLVSNNSDINKSGLLTQKWNAYLVDLRGGYRAGPLLLEAFVEYNGPGNRAKDNLTVKRAGHSLPTLNYFSAFNTGGGYAAGWTNFFSQNEIDYIRGSSLGALGLARGTTTGYDRYGFASIALRPSYALTPALTLTGLVAANWTPEAVDNLGTRAAATGITVRLNGTDRGGEENYLGTEAALKLTWQIAPGLTFDTNFAYLFAGDALAQCKMAFSAGTCQAGKRDADDAQSVAARVRFTF